MALFDAVEGAKALSYGKLLGGKRGRLAMTQDEMSLRRRQVGASMDRDPGAAVAPMRRASAAITSPAS